MPRQDNQKLPDCCLTLSIRPQRAAQQERIKAWADEPQAEPVEMSTVLEQLEFMSTGIEEIFYTISVHFDSIDSLLAVIEGRRDDEEQPEPQH